MKLDYKKTILVGFAFLSICAFWQLYNGVIPLILTDTFHFNETFSGVIMAADNVLALFLLPLFGGISDKCGSKLGRRKPFILFGTIVAVILMMLIPIIDNSYFAAPSTSKVVLFVSILMLLLIAMGTYRSPAVALMPDITPKPLRSMGNAVINLMGALGGVVYLVITSVLYSSARTKGLDHVSYVLLFAIVAGIMIFALVILMACVDEPALCAKQEEYEKQHPEDNLAEETENGEVLPVEVKRSLWFLLASIAFWFIGYNALETWFTTFASKQWDMSLGSASFALTVGMVGAVVSYIPVGHIASRIGRRKTILFGVILLAACFMGGFVMTIAMDHFNPIIYALFVLIGVAWASINVNSLPMVVEMCKGSEVGKYTGLYYTFSMAAQTVTPIAAGWLLRNVGYWVLFLYAAVAVGVAIFTMLQVHHGDAQIEIKKGLEAFDVAD